MSQISEIMILYEWENNDSIAESLPIPLEPMLRAPEVPVQAQTPLLHFPFENSLQLIFSAEVLTYYIVTPYNVFNDHIILIRQCFITVQHMCTLSPQLAHLFTSSFLADINMLWEDKSFT